MDIEFGDFRFDSEQLTLHRHARQIPLKRNQAQLLRLFLSEPQRILSKDEILDRVWQDKVVSEQVVFQTISQLRSLFGNHAIRTYSKQGYQWQLPLNDTSVKSASQSPDNNARAHQLPMWEVCLALLLMVAGGVLAIGRQPDIQPLHLLQSAQTSPGEMRFSDIAAQALRQSNKLSANLTSGPVRLSQAFAAPGLTWRQSDLGNSDWLLWGETHGAERGIFLHYGLASSRRHWQGYLFAESEQQLTIKLARRLEQLQQQGLLAAPLQPLDTAALKSMLQQAPQDPDLLLQLARRHINNGQLDAAMAYLARLENLETDYGFSPYRAEALWHKGKVYKMRSQHRQAANSLDAMATLLADTPLWPLSFHNIKTAAWLAFARTDYPRMLAILERGLALGLALGQTQADPLTLFELHILYSILADKAGYQQRRYTHLNHAQALLMKHKLHEANLAVVYYHFALFAGDGDKAQPYLERLLALPRTAQNYWVHDDAFEMLFDHHIGKNAFDQADTLLAKAGQGADKLVLRAELHLAQHQPELARPLLVQAFDEARLNFDDRTGLTAALALYRLSADQPALRAEYQAYLESNASPEWLLQHQLARS